MIKVMSLVGVMAPVSSYNSGISSRVVAMNVRYSAQRFPLHSPTASTVLQQGVRGDDQPDDPQGRGLRRERLLQLTQNAAAALPGRSADATLHGVQDAIEGLAQRLAVSGEEEHRGGKHAQDQEMHDAVQCDQAQHIAIPQRPPPQRQLDVGTIG